MTRAAGTAPECRPLLVLCALSLLGGLAPATLRAEDALCLNPAAQDPRLDELAARDPDDQTIDIESDSGEMERNGNASLRGNVRVRMGQRLMSADEADIDATERNLSLRGNVEYLDPRS